MSTRRRKRKRKANPSLPSLARGALSAVGGAVLAGAAMGGLRVVGLPPTAAVTTTSTLSLAAFAFLGKRWPWLTGGALASSVWTYVEIRNLLQEQGGQP